MRIELRPDQVLLAPIARRHGQGMAEAAQQGDLLVLGQRAAGLGFPVLAAGDQGVTQLGGDVRALAAGQHDADGGEIAVDEVHDGSFHRSVSRERLIARHSAASWSSSAAPSGDRR